MEVWICARLDANAVVGSSIVKRTKGVSDNAQRVASRDDVHRGLIHTADLRPNELRVMRTVFEDRTVTLIEITGPARRRSVRPGICWKRRGCRTVTGRQRARGRRRGLIVNDKQFARCNDDVLLWV